MRRLPATARPAEPALAIQRPLPLTVATLPAPAGEGGGQKLRAILAATVWGSDL